MMAASGAYAAPRPGVGQRAFWRGWDLAIVFLALILAGDTLNRWGVSAPAWMLVYGLAFLRILSVWPAFWQVLVRNRVCIAYPLVALVSVLWSFDRPATVAGGIQLLMSAFIAMFAGWRYAPRQLMLIALGALGLGVMASAVNWATLVFGGPLYSAVGGLLGIYTNKNMLGHYGLMVVLLAVSVTLMPPSEAPRPLRLLTPLIAGVAGFMVVLSLSMTSVVLMPCYVMLLFLLNRRRMPVLLRFAMVAGVVLLAGSVPLLLGLLGLDPFTLLLDATGKDATLTGRTELWAIAAENIAQAPLFGHGYQAFWSSSQFAAQHFAVLRAGATAPSFHNFIADVMIGNGLIGLIAMLAMILRSLSLAFGFWRRDGSAVAVAALVTLLLPVTLAMVEPYFYRQHEVMTMWVIMMGVSILHHSLPRTTR